MARVVSSCGGGGGGRGIATAEPLGEEEVDTEVADNAVIGNQLSVMDTNVHRIAS